MCVVVRGVQFFEDGLRKARDAIRKLGGTAAFSEDLANFTRTLFKDDLDLAQELLGPEDERADEEYEEVEVDDDDDDEEAYPQEEGRRRSQPGATEHAQDKITQSRDQACLHCQVP